MYCGEEEGWARWWERVTHEGIMRYLHGAGRFTQTSHHGFPNFPHSMCALFMTCKQNREAVSVSHSRQWLERQLSLLFWVRVHWESCIPPLSEWLSFFLRTVSRQCSRAWPSLRKNINNRNKTHLNYNPVNELQGLRQWNWIAGVFIGVD